MPYHRAAARLASTTDPTEGSMSITTAGFRSNICRPRVAPTTRRWATASPGVAVAGPVDWPSSMGPRGAAVRGSFRAYRSSQRMSRMSEVTRPSHPPTAGAGERRTAGEAAPSDTARDDAGPPTCATIPPTWRTPWELKRPTSMPSLESRGRCDGVATSCSGFSGRAGRRACSPRSWSARRGSASRSR